ncbi:hypothetical protein HYPSUDRAFT_210195 [Hypholoma sublateritium FD-334 SS-4]|uniref:Uncharacterized protein n=1 Tax=Hypholoma sublateritium (strain FD-334 SS-4) TaxID=945553 RepID=A0A0D2N0M2_HYPSF|nr:hypothetical protein HYPSUDRAFT_210195 [Hypholoma sublateritium FD-334 SS-4]
MGSCRPQKKRLASALLSAKESYKKRKVLANNPGTQAQPIPPPTQIYAAEIEPIVVDPPLAETSDRPRRENRQMPMRYRVEPPVQLPNLPPPGAMDAVPSSSLVSSDPDQETRQLLKSSYNKFSPQKH